MTLLLERVVFSYRTNLVLQNTYQNSTSKSHSNPKTKNTPFNFQSQSNSQWQANDVITDKVHYGTNVLTP